MIQLIPLYGDLNTPQDAASAEFLKWFPEKPAGEPVLLADHNDWGEPVLAHWPRPNREDLRMLLYGARETGQIPDDTKVVLLPNGKEFQIDA